ncbi:MAG: hypothetical protein GY755_15010 [Chloroflexi bacterium]|nr:hypothetical protein [Chloroflexota bacterium]
MNKQYNINGHLLTSSSKLVFVKKNPKRLASKAHQRFEKYMKAKTVAEFLKLGGLLADLRYDNDKEFLSLEDDK